MNFSLGSDFFGTRLLALSLTATLLCAAGSASAQVPAEAPYDQAVLDLMIQSQTRAAAAQASPEQRAAAIEELNSIYLISSLPRAAELSEVPEVRAQLELQERFILFNAIVTEFLADNQATEQEIFNAYQDQYGLTPPMEFKARHILVDSQGAALGIIEELNNGADFAALAMEKSTGPTGPRGGDLGWFTAQTMVKPFSDAVVAMEDGSFTKTPVQTEFGWHVILREDSRESVPPPLDSMRDTLKQQIEREKFEKFLVDAQTRAEG